MSGGLRAVFALCTTAALAACGDDGGAGSTPPETVALGGHDVGARVDEVDATDASEDIAVEVFDDLDADAGVDAAPGDAVGPEIGPDTRLGRSVTLDDGRVIEGELVAAYDHAGWWVDPSATRTFALFDPTRSAPWPDDRAIVFVDESDVVNDEAIALPPDRPTYRDWLADQGLGVARVPIGTPALVVTAHEEHHLAENGYGDFAWDLVLTDQDGARVHGDGLALDDYLTWDAPVAAPAAGVVVELERGAPDIAPGALPAEGLAAVENLVGLRVDGAFHVYVLHLRQNTTPDVLALGDFVAPGTYLGRVGNSGTTLEPHLHLVVLYWDFERDRFWSVPAELFDVWIGATPRGASHHWRADPGRGDFVASDPF